MQLFFFSSRRRHTRLQGDWSSDVCSSDLVLQRFVVEEPVLTLENAVYKMTGMPAARLGLSDRGLVRPGFAADLVVFDLSRVRDRATNLWPHTYPFENYPHDFPEGIDWVLVNGRLALEDGLPTGSLTGRVLRHPGHSEKPVRPRTSGRTARSRQERGRRSRSRRRRSPEPVPGTRSMG